MAEDAITCNPIAVSRGLYKGLLRRPGALPVRKADLDLTFPKDDVTNI
jgi:hypothetical protein